MSDDLTEESAIWASELTERADYIKTVCADRAIVITPKAESTSGHPFAWCAETERGGKTYHACGDGPDGYDALGNLLELLARRNAPEPG